MDKPRTLSKSPNKQSGMAVTNQGGPSGSTPKFTKPNGGLGFPEETKKPLNQHHPVNAFLGT